jgi:hypothetical protein
MRLSKKKRSAIVGIIGGVITKERIAINKILLANNLDTDAYETIQWAFVRMTQAAMTDVINELTTPAS